MNTKLMLIIFFIFIMIFLKQFSLNNLFKTESSQNIEKSESDQLQLFTFQTNGKQIPHEVQFYDLNKKLIENMKALLKFNYQLLFIYDTKDCNVCVEKELDNCNSFYNKYSQNIYGIILSYNINHVKLYIDKNNILFPVYQDRDGKSLKKFPILTTPVLLLVNLEGTIINSYYPVKGKSENSKNFYKYAELMMQ